MRRRPAARWLLVWMAGLLTATAPSPAAGECGLKAGSRVRWVVPHAVGGGHDAYARLIAPFWERALGVEVVVENHGGVGGLVGIARIRDARPDGTTLGLINGPGTLAAALVGLEGSADLLRDLTVVGQVAGIHHLWLTASSSKLGTLADALALGRERPVVFGLRDVGSSSLADSVVGAEILRLPYELVAGYEGTAARLLALRRGEIDILTLSFEAALGALESGEARALLLIADGPINDHPTLAGVPWLGGEAGAAAEIARSSRGGGGDVSRRTRALVGLMTAGRLVVAPRGLPPELRDCLDAKLAEVLAEPGLRRRAAEAEMAIEPRGAKEVRRDLEETLELSAVLRSSIEAAVRKMRR